jgi:hypothetical protein
MSKTAFERGMEHGRIQLALLQQFHVSVTNREFLHMADPFADVIFKTKDAQADFCGGWTWIANNELKGYTFKNEVYSIKPGHPCRVFKKDSRIPCNTIAYWIFNTTPMCDECLSVLAKAHPELQEILAPALTTHQKEGK